MKSVNKKSGAWSRGELRNACSADRPRVHVVDGWFDIRTCSLKTLGPIEVTREVYHA